MPERALSAADKVLSFYDALADHYHLIFDDWNTAITRQARFLGAVISSETSRETKRDTAPTPLNVLDCACGIGTQALGFAMLGHHVTASDISSAAIARARHEAAARNLTLDLHVSDMTSLDEISFREFDVVAALDNALPHLDPAQLKAATRAMASKLKPGGLFLASIRDYDQLILERPTMQSPVFFGENGTRRIIHQIWDWHSWDQIDPTRYTLHLNITTRANDTWQTFSFHSEYRCLLREQLTATLESAGFSAIRWLMPRESGFYQPLVLAKARG